jgi:sugar-specific transcriptional regulator TrmB
MYCDRSTVPAYQQLMCDAKCCPNLRTTLCYYRLVTFATLRQYLAKLDIEHDTASIYIELTTQGPCSALQVAKFTHISRTQVYRHLEDLQHIGLVCAEQLSYGTLYRALSLENIEGTLVSRETETTVLRQNLASMTQLVQEFSGSIGTKATTQHLYGIAGLKQANWNLTKAKGEFRVFEVAHINQHLDKTFARRCRERCIERGLVSYDLTNATTVTAKDLKPFEPTRTHIRHIDRDVFAINFEVYLYNDVVTLLDYSKDQQLVLEIHHPTLHAMMRQLYDSMWAIATPMTIAKR